MSKRRDNICKPKDDRWGARSKIGSSIDGQIIYGYMYGEAAAESKRKSSQLPEKDCMSGSEPLFFDGTKISFKSVAEVWLESKKAGIKDATYVRYRYLLEHHLFPAFGDQSLTDLDYTHIQRFLLERKKTKDGGGLAVKTLQDVLSVFRLVIRYAEEQCHIQPGIIKIQFPYHSMRQAEKKVTIIPLHERVNLERYLLEDKTDIRKFGIILALYTGVRIGELCALQWRDIDIRNGILYVNHTLQRLHDYEVDTDGVAKTKVVRDTPKTPSSVRAIPLSSWLLSRLAFHGADKSPEVFVLSGTNRPEEPRNYLYFYKKQLRACGLPDYTFHTLRHTFATRCVEEGFDVKSLSEILGHANVRITMDRYVHPSMEAKRRQMERLEVSI